MSTEYTLRIDAETAKEMPMVDLAFELLRAANVPFYYRDLMHEIAKIKELPEEEVMHVIAQLYTEINIDGRFACVGTNLWGLKRWYPVEKAEDTLGNTKRPRIINDEDDDLDDTAIFEGEEDMDPYDDDVEDSDDEDIDSIDDEDDLSEDEDVFEDDDLDDGDEEVDLEEEDDLVEEDLEDDDYSDDEDMDDEDDPDDLDESDDPDEHRKSKK